MLKNSVKIDWSETKTDSLVSTQIIMQELSEILQHYCDKGTLRGLDFGKFTYFDQSHIVEYLSKASMLRDTIRKFQEIEKSITEELNTREKVSV